MIDIHSHLLPGVDDGSRSIETSVSVLERFATHGVEVVVCTPHLDASEAHRAPYERHREILATLVAAAPAAPRLELGWEIMLDLPGVDLSSPTLSLGSSNAVLVEFPRTAIPPRAADELGRLRASGVVPVLAHPERYWGCTLDHIRRWRDVGAVIQLDAAGLLGSESMARLAREMLEHGLADCVASDNHGDGRSQLAAKLWLEELGATEQASVLTRANPGRLLTGDPMLPVAPVRLRRGMLGRLRELMLGRRTPA